MKFTYVIKVLIGALATIMLGAIGSGVWEKILSPSIEKLGEFTTSTLALVSQTYSDSIYRRASSVELYSEPDKGAVLLFLCVLFGLFIYALNSRKEHPLAGILYRTLRDQAQGWYGIIYSGAFIIILFFGIATDSTVSEIKRFSVKNMEVIRPYVEEKEYLVLRSNYLRINNENDFNAFLESLYSLSKKANINIEKYREK